MKYDDMLYDAISQIKQAPKRSIKPLEQPNLDSLANNIIEKLLNKVQDKLPPQKLDAHATVSIEHDAKHWEGLIEKLKELMTTPPNVHIAPASINVAAPDHSLLAEALIEQGEQLNKLGRLLTKKQTITCSVLRDEDGKMAQIIIERQ